MRVLVTGATGTVGSAVVAELVDRGAAVRAFVRHPAAFGADVEQAVGDLADGDSIARALAGADALFLACGNVPGQLELECNAIDAAAAAGVRRVVKLSALGAEPGSPLVFWDWQGRIERHLRASGLPAVVLRPANYMTNLLASADAVARTGTLPAPLGDARVAMIDPRDVAAVAAALLTGERLEPAAHVLTGPAALGYGQVAEALSGVLGRAVEYVDVPPEAAREAMLADGLPPFVVDFLIGLFERQRAGGMARATAAVRAFTGRPPRSLDEFLRDHAVAFTAVNAGPSARTETSRAA